MWTSNFRSALLAVISVSFLSSYHAASYSDLEALGVSCPGKDKCEGYRNHLTYTERSCECDNNCTAYKDCCIDALPDPSYETTRPAARTDVECLNYGENDHTGVYVVSKCSSNWTGHRKIRRACHRPGNFSDPMASSPVTDVDRNETYRNLACAECNNANLASLKTFQLKLSCPGLSRWTPDQIAGNLTYNETLDLWGVNRLNSQRNVREFVGCEIVFDVPGYLNRSVRFCRSNLISRCASDWRRPAIARLCALYTTAIYSNTDGYRNPHCAICNHKTVDEISCGTDAIQRRRPWNMELLIDWNQRDGGAEVGKQPEAIPDCSSGYTYDPFFKSCRQLACGLPGYVLVDGKCTKT